MKVSGVHQLVVVFADQQGVRQVGAAAAAPERQVVGVQPSGAGAAGDAAAFAVDGAEQVAQLLVGFASAAAEVVLAQVGGGEAAQAEAAGQGEAFGGSHLWWEQLTVGEADPA